MNNTHFIIIDLRTKLPLYGIDALTLLFDTHTEATNIANQFFRTEDDYFVTTIKIKVTTPKQ